MEYALRRLNYTVIYSIFLLCFPPYVAIPQSCGCNTVTIAPSTTLFLFLSLHLYLSPSLLPPTVHHALSLHLCRGVSE